MAPTVDKSISEFAAQMYKLGNELMVKLDKHLPVQVSEAASKAHKVVTEYVSSGTASTMEFCSSVPPVVSAYAATVNGHVRERVLPVVQPHIDRVSDKAREQFAPAAAWVEENFGSTYRDLQEQFQAQTSEYSHLELALYAGLGCLLAYFVISRLVSWLTTEPEKPATQRGAEFVRNLPGIRGMVERERAKALAAVRADIASRDVSKFAALMELPHAGLDADSVMAELEDRAANDFRYADGESKATGTVYMAGDPHRELLNDAYCMFSQANPLHTDLFPSIRRMEAEVVAMTASLLGGGHQGVREVCGTMTGGGSESNISAILASIAYMKATKGITQPEIIIAETAHASFWKVANMARAKLVVIPVNKKTYKLTAASVLSKVTSRTAVIVGSAVTYPHGILDDIQGLSNVAVRCRVCLHVDSCLGGYVLPFMRHLRYEVPPFDFALPGVTSMSADTHKYGLAHKGTSVVLYRNKALRRMQFTPVTEWSGGLYVSPGLPGSRSGGLVATAWAAIRHIGAQGYVDITKAMVEAAADFKACVQSVPELQVCGDPMMTAVAFKSVKRSFDIYQLQELLEKKGWHYASLIKPPALHFVVTQQHVNGMDAMKADLLEACDELRSTPGKPASGKAKVYGTAASVSDRGLVADMLLDYQDAALAAE